MGVLNVTPDSFSDGGRFLGKGAARKRAIVMLREGADIIDVGGESARPGAREVSAAEELDRVIPVIKSVAGYTDKPVSIDTRKAIVAEEAIRAGARIVNDVSGLSHDPEMASVIARYGAAVILMHMRGDPDDMQKRASYRDVVLEVIGELRDSLRTALKAGIGRDSIIVDPGIGFAKDAEQSLELIRRLRELKTLRLPICVGVSRKSFISRLLGGAGVNERLAGTIAACAASLMNGADIVRVHDVKESREAAAVIDSLIRRG